jgi:pyruvate dehydrogenase E2 component (dihydrolipoamide acetyltransferase)
MAKEILLPQWGMEMQDGIVVEWLKQEGDPVQEGEPLVAIETEKIQTELESIASGILAHILVPEGSTVPIRTVLAIVADPGEEVPRPAAAPPAAAAPATALPASTDRVSMQVVPAARRLAKQHGLDLAQIQGTGPSGRLLVADVERAVQAAGPAPSGPAVDRLQVQVTPAARRLARQQHIDLAQVQGSGPRGRILIADVEAAIESRIAPQERLAPSPDKIIPITGMRQTIASRMLDSLQTMAQLTLSTEADVTEAMQIREGLARQWTDGGLSPLHFVVKAAACALKEHPRMNALQREGAIELVDEINIGIAVALPEGLIVPTLRRADEKSLADIAREARELADTVRQGKASYEMVTGGTFTLTNLGAYDIDAFTPIINPPQVGILGMGRVVEKPAVYQGGIAKRSLMFLSLTFDHRVIDGVPAAAFLRDIKAYLEDPWWMIAPPDTQA